MDGLNNPGKSQRKTVDQLGKSRTRVIFSDQGLAGTIGGCTTRLICQPFDVLKIRFQVSI